MDHFLTWKTHVQKQAHHKHDNKNTKDAKQLPYSSKSAHILSQYCTQHKSCILQDNHVAKDRYDFEMNEQGSQCPSLLVELSQFLHHRPLEKCPLFYSPFFVLIQREKVQQHDPNPHLHYVHAHPRYQKAYPNIYFHLTILLDIAPLISCDWSL